MKTFDPNQTHEAFRPTRPQINEFIGRQVLGVLSTLDADGAPMGATVALSTTANDCIIVGTAGSSRKSQNVDNDPRVAITVTDVNARYTLQLEGIARKLSSNEFIQEYADEHYAQRPESLPFKDDPNQTHILIEPMHIRFSDCSVNPWVSTEFDS